MKSNILKTLVPFVAALVIARTPSSARADVSFPLYVIDGNDSNIFKVDSGGTISNFVAAGSPGIDPFQMAFDFRGNLYTANNNGTVSEITPGGTVSTFATIGANFRPAGVALDGSGNLYLSSDSSGQIDKITPGGSVTLFATVAGASALGDLAFDAAGNLFVGNTYVNGNIYKITSGGSASLFATTPTEAYGLAFDRNGNLFASDVDSGFIYEVTTDGQVSTFASGDLWTGLAFDQNGLLYAVDGGNNTVDTIDTQGNVATFASGFNGPVDLTFSGFTGPFTVPEPSSAALGALGLAGVFCVDPERGHSAAVNQGIYAGWTDARDSCLLSYTTITLRQ